MKKILFLIISLTIYSQTPVYYPGYPKIIDSTSRPFRVGILLADIDNDGHPEIVFDVIDQNTYVSKLHVIKNNGSYLSGFPKTFTTQHINSVAAGDVNRDGNLEIAIRTHDSVYLIDRYGNNLPGFPVYYRGDDTNYYRKSINLYDLDNDGDLEIITNKVNEYIVYEHTGAVRAGWPRNISPLRTSNANASVGDLDNDGYAEIVTTNYRHRNYPQRSDSGNIWIFRHNGENFPNWPVFQDSFYIQWYASPTLLINRNSRDSTFILVNSPGPRDEITWEILSRNSRYNIYGNIINRNYVITPNPLGTTVVGDLNRDGVLEYVNGEQIGSYVPFLHAYNHEFLILPNWPQLGTGAYIMTPLIGRVTYGTGLNIIAGSWNAENGFGFIHTYNMNGTPLSWSPLRPTGLVYSLAFGDINNDGQVELIAITSRTNTETYLHIWTFPGVPYSKTDHPWPMYGHDRYRTFQYGFTPPDEPIGIQPIDQNIPKEFKLHQNYPNPFNPFTNIRFDVPKTTYVSLVIYDVLGREISRPVSEELKAGEYRISWDAGKYSSGIYFYRLIADGYTYTRKMIVAR